MNTMENFRKPKIKMKTTALRHKQLKFDFDQSGARNTKEVLAHIDALIAENGHITLKDVITKFSGKSYAWSEKRILQYIFDLFGDVKIRFLFNGERIRPDDLKNLLNNASLWRNIEIIKPEVVDKTNLIKAGHICKKLFGSACPEEQNDLCLFLRRNLRSWEKDLNSFCQLVNTGKYPGKKKIDNYLSLLLRLLSIHEPNEFILNLISRKRDLLTAYINLKTLSDFYNHRIQTWDFMLKAIEEFKPNLTHLGKIPEVKNALARLDLIINNPSPYDMIEDISDLVSTVKVVNDDIIEKKTASFRTQATEDVLKKITRILSLLDRENASPDFRNKTLFKLQKIKILIEKSKNIHGISHHLDEAMHEFDIALDLIEEKRTGI
jgi:hypothetical protein